jgi:hypothetical protein
MPISLGSDDGLQVWFNGQKLVSENVSRGAAPDQQKLTLKLRPGKNELLLKITQGSGDFAFYYNSVAPPEPLPPLFVDATTTLAPSNQSSASGRLVAADFNNDGRNDLLLFGPQPCLALASGKGLASVESHGIKFEAGDGLPAVGDFEGDKLSDVFSPSRRGGRLYRNIGGKFVDVTAQSGELARPFGWGASAAFVDLQGNGRMGLVVGCLTGTNRYFHYEGQGKFIEATEEIGFHQKVFNTRGLCVADINQDGVVDVLFNNEAQTSIALLGDAERAAKIKTKMAAK